MVQIVGILVGVCVYASSQVHAALGDSEDFDLSAVRTAALVDTISELSDKVIQLNTKIEKLYEENNYLSHKLEALQHASSEVLYQKWMEAINTLKAEDGSNGESWMDTAGLDSEEDENPDPDIYLEMAADAGHPVAQLEMGLMYAYGSPSVNQSDVVAVKWYRKAALQNQADGQCFLGIAYHVGRGIEQDYKEAMRWYRAAATQGQSTAQNNLGWLLLTGAGGIGDGVSYREEMQREAVRWFYKAAAQGEPFGKANLGVCFTLGLGGLTTDMALAYGLYKDIERADIERYAEVALDESPEWRRNMMRFFQVAADNGDKTAADVLAVYKANYDVSSEKQSFVADSRAI